MLYYETELPKDALTKRFFSNNLFKATLVRIQSEEFQKNNFFQLNIHLEVV